MNSSFTYENNMKLFTKYINKRLSGSMLVDTWGFYVSGDERNKYEIYVEIDYINDFHSRDMYYISPVTELYDVQHEFEITMDRHFSEFKEALYRRNNE